MLLPVMMRVFQVADRVRRLWPCRWVAAMQQDLSKPPRISAPLWNQMLTGGVLAWATKIRGIHHDS
jgi:hypothetical protein